MFPEMILCVVVIEELALGEFTFISRSFATRQS